MQVYCKGTVSPQALFDTWESIPEVVSASTVTGQADAILRVRARDVRHLEQALEQIRGDADHRPHRVDHRAVPADRAGMIAARPTLPFTT